MDNDIPIDLEQLKPQRTGWKQIILDHIRREDLRKPEVEFPPPPVQLTPDNERPRVSLAIDFGTSAIAVALVGSNPRPDLFKFRQVDQGQVRPFLETAVRRLRQRMHSLLVDNYALPQVYAPQPDWAYDACLKRRIEWLARTRAGGDWKESAILDVAAVTSHILHLAWKDQDQEDLRKLIQGPVYVSIPNTFPREGAEAIEQGVACGVAAMLRLDRLPVVKTLLEAEAVAHSVLSQYSQGPQPEVLLVIDAGAGTTDTSIVRCEKNGLRVVAHTGLPVGGLDLDALIAQQEKAFENMEPQEIESTLRNARDLKLNHWNGADGATGSVVDRLGQGTARIAEALNRNDDPQKQVELEANLSAGYRRYLGLAVHALLDCLPHEELIQVKHVILSGRASLLLGFEEEVVAALAARGAQARVEGAGQGDERKLAVLNGVAAYARDAQSAAKRRPLRAGYELVLRRPIGRETCLLPIGAPLIDGWGVASWSMSPMLETGEWPIHVRTLPHRVIDGLIQSGFFTASDRDIAVGWSSRPVLIIRGNPPFTDCCAFDFLTQKALSGRESKPDQKEKGGEVFRSHHPVHYAQESWFERFLGDSA